jgi:hypothetical protein
MFRPCNRKDRLMFGVLIVISGILGSMAYSLFIISVELNKRNKLLEKQMESKWSFQNERSK